MYARDLNEPKYQVLIKKHENAGIKYLSNPNAFIACSNAMDDVYENINDYNPTREKKSKSFLMTWLQVLWQIKDFEP